MFLGFEIENNKNKFKNKFHYKMRFFIKNKIYKIFFFISCLGIGYAQPSLSPGVLLKSETTQTGEYIQAGSFIIRGKKNYIPTYNLDLGVTVYNNEIMICPYKILETIERKLKVKIQPGNQRRNKVLGKITEYLHIPNKYKDVLDYHIPFGIYLVL